MLLLYCALAYMIGIAVGRFLWEAGVVGCGFPGWLWWLPLLALPGLYLLRQRRMAAAGAHLPWPMWAGFAAPRWPGAAMVRLALLGCCLLTGALRFASHPLAPCWTAADLAYHNLPADRAFDREAPRVTLEGWISTYPMVSDTTQRLAVTATALTVDGRMQPVAGQLRLSTDTRVRYQYGRPVRLHGRLVTPPDFEDFSYREFLSRKGIHSLFYGAEIDILPGPLQGSRVSRALYGLRGRGEAVLNRLLPEPYAGLANGMLLGIEAGIPDDLYERFNLTGTSHVIVISGSNVALISGVMMALGQRIFGRRRAVYPTLAGIAAYALLVGGDAAVMRAALMGGLFVWATALGRRSTALVSLSTACMVMTLVNPLTLWDVGFQLSSAATAGLILFTPGITAAFSRLVPSFQGGFLTASAGTGGLAAVAGSVRSFLRGLLEDGLIVTLAANLTTLPLVVYYFGRLSVVSLLTNLLIAPAQPFIMLWGSAGVLVGAAGLLLPAQLILWVPWLCLVWTVAMVTWTAGLPGASLEIAGYGSGALGATYLALLLVKEHKRLAGWRVGLGRASLRGWAVRVVVPVLLAGMAVAAFLVWRMALTQPDGRLHIHFLDIGQGDGIFIQTPSGRQVLVDGGASPQLLFSELGEVMPFWDRTLDLLLLTHPDGDHMLAQAEAPFRFSVAQALDTAVSQTSPDGAPWRENMARAGVPVALQHQGGWIDLGDGVALWVLWPPPGGLQTESMDNENSLVARLVYGDFSVLLTGDAGLPSEAVWLRSGAPLHATVLKVGHHGSRHSTGADFVAAVDPRIAVIQVGADNDYGHPTADVLENLAGRLVLRTDEHGRVHLWSDGQRLWLETERGQVERE